MTINLHGHSKGVCILGYYRPVRNDEEYNIIKKSFEYAKKKQIQCYITIPQTMNPTKLIMAAIHKGTDLMHDPYYLYHKKLKLILLHLNKNMHDFLKFLQKVLLPLLKSDLLQEKNQVELLLAHIQQGFPSYFLLQKLKLQLLQRLLLEIKFHLNKE